MSRAIALLLGGSILVLLLSVFAFIQPPQEGFACHDFSESSLTINTHKISVAIANTPAQQARGLSGCESLPENSGMLFPYNPSQQVSFWMKDMVIPIDIVWIRDGEVIGLETNVPPPSPSTPDSQLLLYKSPGPITAVLELKSGGAQEYSIEEGSKITFPD